jgi:hypothetical protein
LIGKYGEPKFLDNSITMECQNKGGARFENKIGTLDAIWTNGEVRAVYRAETLKPTTTCTDMLTMTYYILGEPSNMKAFERAIESQKTAEKQKKVNESPF